MKTNIFKPVIFSIIIASAFSFTIQTFVTMALPQWHWIMSVCFFSFLSLVLNIVYIQRTDSRTFINTIMVSSGARLLASAVAFLIYAYNFQEYNKPFVFHFMVHYMVFAIFEIVLLLKIVNTQSNKS